MRLPEHAILGQTVHMYCNFTLPAGHHNFYSLKVRGAAPRCLLLTGDISVVPGPGRGLQVCAGRPAGAAEDGVQHGQHQDRPAELQDDRGQGAPAGPADGEQEAEWRVLVPGDNGHSALPVHTVLLVPHRHGPARETPRHIRPQADNLSPRRQGLHQLHLQPQLPRRLSLLAAEQQEGGQVDGHLLPPHLGPRRPGEHHPRPQLPRPARALPRPRAGALGHLQSGHAHDPRDGDPHGENSPPRLHPGPAPLPPGRLGGCQWDGQPGAANRPRHPRRGLQHAHLVIS